jgi:hypothetical protein
MMSGGVNCSTVQSLPTTPAIPSQLIKVAHAGELGFLRLLIRAGTSSEFDGKPGVGVLIDPKLYGDSKSFSAIVKIPVDLALSSSLRMSSDTDGLRGVIDGLRSPVELCGVT